MGFSPHQPMFYSEPQESSGFQPSNTQPSPNFVVPETQESQGEAPEPKRRVHRKKPVATDGSEPAPAPTTKRKTTPWSSDEKEALFRAWIAISEDRHCADYQQRKIFWTKVRETFHMLVGSTERNADMISGRWSEIRKFVGLFTNLFNRNSGLMRPSGSDNLAVYNFTVEEWKQECLRRYGVVKTWDDLKLWDRLKKCSKWVELVAPDLDAEVGPKQTKTSSSGAYSTSTGSDCRVRFDLNIAEEETSSPPRRRPLGRDAKGKKPAEGEAVNIANLVESLNKFNKTMEVVSYDKKEKT
ncbi:uncharacterized protein LOC143579678 [Bidens hawaiensis]|uniref:uncharacterized protein LOC143579678 n=1 Tax=Bidens hawaiensis TaxID=980011 RepID=UPI00404AC3BF